MMKKSFLNRCLSTSMSILLAAALMVSPNAFKVSADSGPIEYTENETALRNVMYYGDWSIWGGQGMFYPGGIPADQLTHLNFAFLDFDADGSLRFTDRDAAVGAPVGMPGVQWGAANAGILSAMQHLRAENPNLRIGVSLGGWSKSGDFSVMAANPVSRANFVNNVMKFIRFANMDFVDLDWEYPTDVRAGDHVDNILDEGTPHASPADKANFITLLSDLRDALDAQGDALGRYYELTVALSADQVKLNNGVDLDRLFEIVDFANMMTYDLHGAWDSISGHHTGLYTNPMDPNAALGFSVNDCVQYLLSNNVPSNKIVVGVAFYTRGWEQVNDDGGVPGLPGLFGTAEQVSRDADFTPSYGARNEAPLKSGEGGRSSGVWSLGSLDKLNAAYPGLEEYWDDYAKAPYLYNEDTGAFFTFDNERSIREKASYVLANDLGGCITWMQSMDEETDTPGRRDKYTKVIKEALFGTGDLTDYIISDTSLDVSAEVKTYSDSTGQGYEFVIRNNETRNESGEVLSLLEAAYETVKSPKIYIKTTSGSTFSTGGYGSGTVTNQNGYGIADLSTVYDNRIISPGGSVTFKLKVNGTVSLSDIISIELSQRIIPSGIEVSKQAIRYNVTGVDPTDPTDPTDPGDVDNTYDITKIYVAGDIVTYNGHTYRAKWWTRGNIPSTEPYGPWELIE